MTIQEALPTQNWIADIIQQGGDTIQAILPISLILIGILIAIWIANAIVSIIRGVYTRAVATEEERFVRTDTEEVDDEDDDDDEED